MMKFVKNLARKIFNKSWIPINYNKQPKPLRTPHEMDGINVL